jgi:GDP-D-mannose dehydratase
MIDQKQQENVQYLNYCGTMIKIDARYTREVEFRIVIAKASHNRKKTLFTWKCDLNLRKKLVKCYT